MHPLYPLLSPQIFESDHIHPLTSSEALLLATMVTIASRYCTGLLPGRREVIHGACARWAREEISFVMDGVRLGPASVVSGGTLTMDRGADLGSTPCLYGRSSPPFCRMAPDPSPASLARSRLHFGPASDAPHPPPEQAVRLAQLDLHWSAH